MIDRESPLQKALSDQEIPPFENESDLSIADINPDSKPLGSHFTQADLADLKSWIGFTSSTRADNKALYIILNVVNAYQQPEVLDLDKITNNPQEKIYILKKVLRAIDWPKSKSDPKFFEEGTDFNLWSANLTGFYNNNK